MKAFWRASTAPEVQRPLTHLCVWDGGVFEALEELSVWAGFLLLSHWSLGRRTEALKQRL